MIKHKLSVGELRRLNELDYCFYIAYSAPELKLPTNNSLMTVVDSNKEYVYLRTHLVTDWLDSLKGSEMTFLCELESDGEIYDVNIIIPEGGF